MTAVGVLTADLIWASASIVGLTALLVASQFAFDAVRVIGAAYLIYLGIQLIRTRGLGTGIIGGSENDLHGTPRRRAFREGLICDLSNPKTVVVYAGVIPQFLAASSSPSDALLLGLVFASLGFCSLLLYALVFGAAGGFLSDTRLLRNALRGSGGILVLFGVGLLGESPRGAVA